MDASLGMVEKNTKVKIKGAHVNCYVDPLYGTKPYIIFDKKIKLLHRSFGKSVAFLMKRYYQRD
jgi:hypothetical protein